MEPFERFKKLCTEGNLWIYALHLGIEIEICDADVRRLIFEKFGFLPGGLLVKQVLFQLRRKGLIKNEKFQGKKAYKTTKEGGAEIEKMKKFCQELLHKI